MHRPPARRPRRGAVALLTLLAASCGDGDVTRAVAVDVAAQPCDRPTRSRGLGVVVADGIVATAAHTVEGPLRALTVDDVPARVVSIDPRTDLALLAVDLTAEPAELATVVPDVGTVITADGPRDARIVRTGTLVVHDATDRARYEREVHTFSPGVDEGTSGAPLVDGRGRMIGVVVLDNRGEGVAYAVTAVELAALLDDVGSASAASHVCPAG